MSRRNVCILFLFCLLVSMSKTGTLCYAQTASAKASKTQLTLSEKVLLRLKSEKIKVDLKNNSFQEALETLGLEGKLNFIADDIPSEDKFTFKFEGDIKAVIDKFADFYDYSWKVGRGGEIQMMKQFCAPRDFPQANRAELLQVVKEMQSVMGSLGSFPGKENLTPYTMNALYRSLTDSQVNYIKSGKDIAATQLNGEQYDRLKKATVSYLSGEDVNSCELFKTRITQLNQSYFIRDIGDYNDILFIMFTPNTPMREWLGVRGIPVKKNKKVNDKKNGR